MPLIVAIVLAHVGGLCAIGLPAVLVVSATAAGSTWLVSGGRAGRRAERATVALCLVVVALAGVGRRAVAERHQAACLAARYRADAVVWLDDAVSPGRTVTGEWRWRRCALRIQLRVTAGSAEAGDGVRLDGDVLIAPRGLRVAETRLRPMGGRAARLRIRAAVHGIVDEAFGGGEPAAFARALLTGDASRIAPDARDRWADAGLVHLISVSGLHIAVVIDSLTLLLRRLRVARARAEVGGLVFIGVYLWLLGSPAPAVRAAVTAAVSIGARRLDRPTNPWAIWALACAVPLTRATAPLDVGYQLSALGAAALVIAGTIERRRIEPPLDALSRRATRWRRDLRRSVRRALLVSVCASLVTMPVTLWTFGRVSLISPLTNLVGGPLMSIAQPALFLVVLAAPVPGVGRVAAWVVRASLAVTDGVAEVAARVPGASLALRPSLLLTSSLATGIALLGWAMSSARLRRRQRAAWGVLALAATPWSPLIPVGRPRCGLHAIDVGQGDGIAIRTGAGRWIIVDAGPAWRGGDAGQRAVLPYLARWGGDVALAMVSHADLDHAGGMASVVRARRPPVLWDPGFAATAPHYRDLLAATAGSTRWHRARAGDSLRLDDVLLEVLAPDAEWLRQSRSTNDASLIVRATCLAAADRPAVRFLLMGDAETGQEEALVVTQPDALRADVLKVPHHGSRTSSTEALLEAVSPKQAIISVGADNRYGHPAQAVLDRYAERGIVVRRTDRDGSIVVEAGPTGPTIVRR